MKKVSKILTFILALALLCGCFSVGALAAGAEDAPKVRVNGYLVDFPDGQPFIDGNDRTLIPVRFVTEKLGASVSWDAETQTAKISRDGTTVEISIGSPTLRVTKSGKTTTVQMDTAAVLANDRTYVPIRYVAEQLGAFVDYADYHRVVGIFSDVLDREQISELQAADYTVPGNDPLNLKWYKQHSGLEETEKYFGTDRDTFGNFANAREHLYHVHDGISYWDDEEECIKIIDRAVEILKYDSEGLTIRLLADHSCIYQPDAVDSLYYTVRGYAVVDVAEDLKAVSFFDIGSDVLERLYDLNLYWDGIEGGATYYIAVDVHMYDTGKGSLISIVPLTV